MMSRLTVIPASPRVNNRIPPPCGGTDAYPVPMSGKNNKDTHHG